MGLNVSLTSSASGGIGPYAFTWSFGDGNTGTGQNTTHFYTTGGTFFPKIIAVDNTLIANGTDLGAVIVFSGALQLRVNNQNGRPIIGANITSLTTPPGQSVFTVGSDSLGTGRVACLVPGSYRVRVSNNGYMPTVASFVVANVTITPTVTLTSLPSPSIFPLVWILYLGIGAVIIAGLVAFTVYRSKRLRRQ
jgi:hypothetical protein